MIPEPFEIGRSVLDAPILCTKMGKGEEVVLVIGGTHGDEIIAYELAESFLDDAIKNQERLEGKTIYFVPHHNPDAIKARSRVNANQVDINRNFDQSWLPDHEKSKYNPGNSPLSEPESRHMANFVKAICPARILSIHSPLDYIDYDGEAAKFLAELMAAKNKMKVQAIPYETPGSFGKFCLALNIPLVTLELPKVGSKEDIWSWQREALWAFIEAK